MRIRAAVPLAVAVLAAVTLPGHADSGGAPTRTGWWSAASGNGTAVPQPSTADGDLRVMRVVQTSQAPGLDAPAAFAAVLYRAEGTRGALTLKLRDQRVVGTPDIAACPTKGTTWKAGGDQPIADAPAVDCGLSTSFGVVSADGTSVSFTLDPAFQVEPGTWSVALVPTPGDVSAGPPPSAPLPFSADVVKPDATSFSTESGDDAGSVVGDDSAVGTVDAAAPVDTSTSDTGTSSAPLPAALGSVPTGTDTTSVSPAIAPSGVDSPVVAGTTPASAAPSAGTRAAAPRRAVRPAAQTSPTTDPRLLVLVALVGLAAWLGRESARPGAAPRLLGGRARFAGAAAPGDPPSPAGDERERGLGRFTRTRDAAPRRLR